MGKSKKSRWKKRDIRDVRGWRKSRKSTKTRREKSKGRENSKRKKNYMLLIIFMVLIFNSLSSPETKKQQHMNYLQQAQKKSCSGYIPSFFPGGSVILCDEQQHPHSHPHPMWRRQGTLAEIFAKMMCFLKQGEKRGGRHLILAYIKLSLFHKASG